MTSSGTSNVRYGARVDLYRTLIVSVFLHALILSLILFSSLPRPKWTFGPIYSVELVSLADSTPAPPHSSLSREFMESGLQSHAAAFRKRVEPLSPPVRRIETPKKTIEGLETAMEKVKQRASAAKAPPQAVDNRTPMVATSSRDPELGAKMNAYYAQIWSRIRGQWAVPSAILPREDIEAVIHTQISRMGTVIDVSFEKHSGNRYFDESAMKAIRKASPFPPLPEGVTDSSIEVGIRFHSKELR